MRHRITGTKFNVDKDHRKMLLRNLLTSLILHGEITTTEAKAKALKSVFDKFVTRVKSADLAARRYAVQTLLTKKAYEKTFTEVLPRLGTRKSGYTNIIRHDRPRVGDNAKYLTVKIVEKS
jgi:large subunit ribosomal protein L17